jgi:hypothetical protein
MRKLLHSLLGACHLTGHFLRFVYQSFCEMRKICGSTASGLGLEMSEH